MKPFYVLSSVLFIGLALLACGGEPEEPAVPTLPPRVTPASVSIAVEQPGQVGGTVPQSSTAGNPRSQADSSLNQAIELPRQLRDEAPLLPAWPTFTPGPRIQTTYPLLFARGRRFFISTADGSDIQQVKFKNKIPQLLGRSYKDPGRGWLSPSGNTLVFFAGKEAQLWVADTRTWDNYMLVERMIPVGMEDNTETIRILTDQEMVWSPDETRFAFIGAPQNFDLFIADLQTNQVIQVTQDDLHESRARWSPDGRYLVFVVTDPRVGIQSLQVFDTAQQQVKAVDLDPVRQALELEATATFVFPGDLIWVGPQQLAFYPQSRGRSAGIWLHDVASGTTQALLANPIESPQWSPAARAWVYSIPDEPGALWYLPLDNPQPVLLVKEQAYAPVWSPDGRKILYSWSNPDSLGWDLHVMDLEGHDVKVAENVTMIQRMPPEPGPAGKRYWSPDSRFILFTMVGAHYGRAEQKEGYGGEAGPDLENWWIVPAEGGEPRQATDMLKVFYVQEPVLSPDGTAWAYVAFSYTDRLQHLYTMGYTGGHPNRIDAGVRWFRWLPTRS